MSPIPMSWMSAPLNEVAKIIRGITFPANEKSLVPQENFTCCLRTANVQKKLDWTNIYFVPNKHIKRQDQLIAKGDTIISMANSYELVGKVAIAETPPFPAAFGAFIAAIRTNEHTDNRYVYFFLKTNQAQSNLRSKSSQTTNIANISATVLGSLEIPLAPLAEQTRIADKLDAVLSRVDDVNARLARVAPLLKRFRQSVLAAATSGRLTEDWRDNGATWEKTTVQEIADVGTGSTPLRSKPEYFTQEGTAWITSSATGQEVIQSAQEFVTPEAITAHRLKKYPVGTLLVAMYGEGKTRGQVSELAIEATINQACAAIVVNEKSMLKNFVKLALKANYIEMREMAEGGNQPNLNLSKIKEFSVPRPSIEEQAEIVRRVEVLFAFADRLEARLKGAQAAAQRLTPAVLAKAFRGELVAQDPADEPAAELLKRLAAQRAQAPAGARRGRSGARS